jgi:hypothetical protein
MTENKLNYSNNLLTVHPSANCLCPLCTKVLTWPAKGKEDINALKDLDDMLKELSR